MLRRSQACIRSRQIFSEAFALMTRLFGQTAADLRILAISIDT